MAANRKRSDELRIEKIVVRIEPELKKWIKDEFGDMSAFIRGLVIDRKMQIERSEKANKKD